MKKCIHTSLFATFLSVIIFIVESPGAYAFCLWNCSPPDIEVRSLLRNLISQSYTKPVTIETFKKTNGQKTSYLGRETYVFYFQAKLRFSKGGGYCSWGDGMRNYALKQWCLNLIFSRELNGKSPQAGQTTIVHDKLYYSKTENGWVGRIAP